MLTFCPDRWTMVTGLLVGLVVVAATSKSATPARFQVDYVLDDCTPEWSVGRGGVGDLWVANGFTAQDGGEVIVSIEASFWQAQGVPLGVHLYDDPDDDWIPDDLVMLQTLQTTFPPFGACHEFPIPPTRVSGVFFVALSYPDSWGELSNYEPFVLDDSTDKGETWFLETSVAGSLDPVNLPTSPVKWNSVLGGQFFIRATGVPLPVSITAMRHEKAAGKFAVEWGSALGAFYEILKTHHLGVGDWVALDPDRFPPGGAPATTSVYDDGSMIDEIAFYRVRRTTPPAVLEENFETEAVGWVAESLEPEHPTWWELGAPLRGPYSARSGSQAFGTALGGDYADDAHANLRSPLIDLTAATASTLSFWYIVDFGDNIGKDEFRVEVLNPAGTILLENRISGLSTWFWNYFELPLPPTALVGPIYLSFTLEDHNDGKVGRGVYIDDVRVISAP